MKMIKIMRDGEHVFLLCFLVGCSLRLEEIFICMNPVFEKESGSWRSQTNSIKKILETWIKMGTKRFYFGNFGPVESLQFGGTVSRVHTVHCVIPKRPELGPVVLGDVE